MAVTNSEKEYQRLRSYLNAYFKGPNVEAILRALAEGASSSLIDNAAAVNDQMYVISARGRYLDQLLADYNIRRPPNIGLSDDIFRQIGIQVKNRKQVRDLINNILNLMFGDTYTRAINKSEAIEPYALSDGDTLIVNFDENHTVTVTFEASQFTNIAAATAVEVADAITITLKRLGLTGVAIANNDGNGSYVQLMSQTIGPVSSVTVRGGSAQNELRFPSIISAGGNMSTQWTISLQPGAPGGVVRFTWTGGANPNLGNVQEGDYVNIFNGGFASSPNQGSYTILRSIGGTVGNSYFEVQNPFGQSGIVVQGTADAILFFTPIRKSLNSLTSYAAVYQTESRMLQIFIPATTQVIGRTRKGAAYLHSPPNVVYTFNANPNINDVFQITSGHAFVASVDFAIGSTIEQTIINLAAAINAVTGLDAVPGDVPGIQPPLGTLTVYSDSPSLVITGTYTGSASITTTGLLGDMVSVQPNQFGPYTYDLTQNFTVSSTNTELTQDLNSNNDSVFSVGDASAFPDAQGYLIFGYGTDNQEGPVPYIGRPSNSTLLISPAYSIKKIHPVGTSVFLISQNAPPTIASDGSDYPFYLTDVVSGRIYAQDLINSVAATGINIVFTILYPNDIGLGKWGTQYSEISIIYGP